MDDYGSDEEVKNVQVKRLCQLMTLPITLTELNCFGSKLSRLPELPETLRILKCAYNDLSHLPKLPALTYLDIRSNDFKRVRGLSPSLTYLSCGSNKIVELSNLSHSLNRLNCGNNQLTKLELPPHLQELYCMDNQIQSLDLPSGLKILQCCLNKMETLILPDTLEKLDCTRNKIRSLNLNERLIKVSLSYNPLVPILPKGLQMIDIQFTKIENCFEFADNMKGGIFLYGTPLYRKIKAVVKTEERITCPVVIKMAFQIIRNIEHRFKHIYYSMKARTRLMSWMWRAREKIAMKKYHPDELFKRLDYGFDAVEQW